MKRTVTNKASIFVLCTFVIGLWACTAHASVIYEYALEIFTNNGLYYNDPAVDVYVQVSDQAGQVRFEFHNDSTVASSVADIYFDDGSLLGIANIDNGLGTAFSQWATPPDLPAGNTLIPPFQTTEGFSADSDSPPPLNGVNPGEWVAIIFNLVNGATLDDVIDDLNDGTLRIGAHIIAFPDGSSEAAVNVPEPATLVVLGIGGLLALLRRRR